MELKLSVHNHLSAFIHLSVTFIIFSFFPPLANATEAKTCSYHSYKWNTLHKQAVARKTVRHPYATLKPYQVDPRTGCSVCEEDQEIIQIASLKPFKVCRRLSRQIKATLHELIQSGVPIYQIVGYRVGMTRGDIDTEGNRTRFSNHSFGVALDINPGQNGLYSNCIEFGPGCKLIRGGNWIPGQPGSLLIHGPVVNALKNIGFLWGGEIAGKQKDFMHFSLTGY